MLDTAVAVTDRGVAIFADPGDRRGVRLVETGGDVNPGSLRLWRHLVGSRAWSVIIDVGANYGEMLVGAELPAEASVLAFEPNEQLHPYLRRTFAQAGLAMAEPASGGDRRPHGHDDARRGRRVVGHVLAVDAGATGRRALDPPRRPGDDSGRGARRRARQHCAKVDVEGWEPQVVAGATRSLSWTEPWALMLEVLHVPRLFLAGLAQRFPLLALDLRTDRFVRLPGGNGMLLDDLLDFDVAPSAGSASWPTRPRRRR